MLRSYSMFAFLLLTFAPGVTLLHAQTVVIDDHVPNDDVDRLEVQLLPRPARMALVPIERKPVVVRSFAADGTEQVTVIETERRLVPQRPVIPTPDPARDAQQAVYSLFEGRLDGRGGRAGPERLPSAAELR